MTDVAFSRLVYTKAAESLNRTLIITFTPVSARLPSTAAKGTVVATISAHWSTGGTYSGPFAFGGTHGNYNGIFAISGNKVVINPAGLGIASLAGQTVDIKIIR